LLCSPLSIHVFIIKHTRGGNAITTTTTAITTMRTTTSTTMSSTPRYYSHSMCKRVFRVKLFVSSIHSCIHHYYLYPNTEKDMDRMVSRLLHDVLPVAYQPIVVVTGTPSNNIHRTDANMCVQSENEIILLYYYSLVYSS